MLQIISLITLLTLGGCGGGSSSGDNYDPAYTPLPPITDNLPERLRGATLSEWHGYWYDPGYIGWENIGEFPRWGGNYLSLLISPYLLDQPIPPGNLSARLDRVVDDYSAVIDWALAHNIYVSMRFWQLGQRPERIWPDDARALWLDVSAQDELVQAWEDLARRFKGRKGILFDLVTEPYQWKNEVTTPELGQIWNAFYPRLIQAIRAEDPERWIIVEPASSWAELAVSVEPKVVYEFHHYDHEFTGQGLPYSGSPAGSVPYPGWVTDTTTGTGAQVYLDKSLIEQRMQPAIDFRDTNNVRVIAGEFGSAYLAPMDSRVRWTMDVIDLLEQHGFDWAYFTYDAMHWSECTDRCQGTDGHNYGPWGFESTPIAPVVTSKFALNIP